MAKSRALVYPLKRGYNFWNHGKRAKWCELELLHSLRSVDKFWTGDEKIVILAQSLPPWINRELVEFRRAVTYMEAIGMAADVADEIVWMNDDIVFMKPTRWEDLFPVRCGGDLAMRWQELLDRKNGWQRRKGKVTKKLVTEFGKKRVMNFSTHLPYPYVSEQLRETVENFQFGYKTPIELAHFNFHDIEWQMCRDKLSRHSKRGFPLDLRPFRFMNYADSGMGPKLKGFLRGLHPWPSKYEVWDQEDLDERFEEEDWEEVESRLLNGEGVGGVVGRQAELRKKGGLGLPGRASAEDVANVVSRANKGLLSASDLAERLRKIGGMSLEDLYQE